MKNISLYILLLLVFTCGSIKAQEAKKVITQAMEEEIARNLQNLHLDGMKDPFYISFSTIDVNMFALHSAYGGLLDLRDAPMRIAGGFHTLVGDFNSNNLNFLDSKSASFFPRTTQILPLDNSVQELKRSYWKFLDNAYKLSTEIYESKQSALKSKSQDEEISGLADFLPSEKVLIEKPEISLSFDNQMLIKYSNEISLVFKSYPFLSDSWVRITGFRCNNYYLSSEGSKAYYPSSVLRMVIQAEALTPNGEVLELTNFYHVATEADLPAKEQVIKDAQAMVATLTELKNAPVFDDVYNGPVLFEEQSAAEVVRKTMFSVPQENLCAVRKPVMGTTETSQLPPVKISADNRIDKKISAEGFFVKAKPLMTSFQNIPLIGSYPIDMDGIIPPEETVLIDNGVLKNLLSGRNPTTKMKSSNGHYRYAMGSMNPLIVPGVIEIESKAAISKEELRKKLIEMAKEEGLEYALIVKEMVAKTDELRKVYKIDVATGKETLIRSANLKGPTINDLRKIVGVSNSQMVYNTTVGEHMQPRGYYYNGYPASFITPDAFLLKDMEVSKNTKPRMTKAPVTTNPLEL